MRINVDNNSVHAVMHTSVARRHELSAVVLASTVPSRPRVAPWPSSRLKDWTLPPDAPKFAEGALSVEVLTVVESKTVRQEWLVFDSTPFQDLGQNLEA